MLIASAASCDSGDEATLFSQFPGEDTFARSVGGRVYAGTELAPGAVVRLDPKPGYAADAPFVAFPDPAWTIATDGSGTYRFRTGPLRYDLSVRLDRELTVYEDLAHRYFEPSLVRAQPVQGFRATVKPVTDPPPKAGNAIAYFVSGEGRAVTGDSSMLQVVFRPFDTVITVHAVEYVAKEGLASAVAEGRNEVRVQSGAAAAVVIAMRPLAVAPSELVFDAPPPDGFVASKVDVVVDYGVTTSQHVAATVAQGSAFRFTRIGGARYQARARATRSDGAVSDSGLLAFDPAEARVELALPAPATLVPRASAETFATFTATGGGVYEHLLTPASGSGTTVRVVTAGDATLPDVTRLGLEKPIGPYRWTVTRWADLERPEELSGPETRVRRPWATTPGGSVELR